MLFKKAVLPMVIVAALSGCGDASLDGSSDATLNQSIVALSQTIPAEHRSQFQEDIDLIRMYYENNDPARLLSNLHGKNALDIMTEANNLRVYIQRETKRQATEEQKQAYLNGLNDQQHEVAVAIDELEQRLERHEQKKRFSVDSAAIHVAKGEDNAQATNTVELSMSNNTAHTVHGVLLTGELSSEQGPLLVAPLDIQIEDGIEPGQSKTFVINPSLASEWRDVEVPELATLLMTVDELVDVDSNLLFPDNTFTEADHRDLISLRSALKVIQEEILMVVGPYKSVEDSQHEAELSVDIAQPLQPEVAIEVESPSPFVEGPKDESQPVVTEQAEGAGAEPTQNAVEPGAGLNQQDAKLGADEEAEVGQAIEPLPSAELGVPAEAEQPNNEPLELPSMVIYAAPLDVNVDIDLDELRKEEMDL